VKGRRVQCWHPESPGIRLTVYRPWWRRKRRPFATLAEALRVGAPHLNAIDGR
jgi:hypothetical protein